MAASLVSVYDLAEEYVPLYPAESFYAPNCAVRVHVPPEILGLTMAAYGARIARVSEVLLARVRPGCEVYRWKDQYLLQHGDAFLDEQVLPELRNHDGIAAFPAWGQCAAAVEIDCEAVLIARHGERTWGHWLDELLPKAAVCERWYPGRFFYVVPDVSLDERTLFGWRAMESLYAYGVPPERIIRIRDDVCYRFSRLHVMSSIWSDMMMHPRVAHLMREVRIAEANNGAPVPGDKFALLRGDNRRRGIANHAPLRSLLRDAGFTRVDIGFLPFAAQVRLFRQARTIFSVLGSSLAGLVYSTPSSHVLAVAPEMFSDRFFYALMQLSFLRYAEIKGPVAGEDPHLYRDSSFTVPVETVARVLAEFGVFSDPVPERGSARDSGSMRVGPPA